MSLVFKSSVPEKWEIRGTDSAGKQRVATAVRSATNSRMWDITLRYPSGHTWPASYHGEAVIDALGELVNSKDAEYRQERARGYRPEPATRDRSRSLPEFGDVPEIVRTDRYNIPPRR